MTFRKIYVDIDVKWSANGTFTPIAIYWKSAIDDEEERYEIDAILEGPIRHMCYSGGVGNRYTIKIGKAKRYLFFGDDKKWFIESNK